MFILSLYTAEGSDPETSAGEALSIRKSDGKRVFSYTTIPSPASNAAVKNIMMPFWDLSRLNILISFSFQVFDPLVQMVVFIP